MKKLLPVILILCSCTQESNKWNGGPITNKGEYIYNDNKITVYGKGHSLMYNMIDQYGDTLLQQDEQISMVHNWALHLDDEMNLWVLSSDIGHSCWERDSTTGEYSKHKFYGPIEKHSIPDDVFKTISLFYPYR